MNYVLITGSGNGLGYALSRQYLGQGWTVFCGLRSADAPAYHELRERYGELAVASVMDVSDTGSVRAAFEQIGQRTARLDLLINNAGVLPDDSGKPLEAVDIDSFLSTIDVNAAGALRVAQSALPLLRKSSGSVIANISSAGGSLTHIVELDGTADDYPYAYCMSKAALNMWSAILQRYCRADGIKVLCIHPGVMKTRMNADRTPEELARMISPEESAEGIASLIQERRWSIDGPFFYDYTGKVFPY